MDPSLLLPMIQSAVTQVVVDASDIPPLYLPKPFEPGPPNPFLQKERPRIRFYNGDQLLFTIAPYGTPTQAPYTWDEALLYGELGASALLLAALYGVYKLVRG